MFSIMLYLCVILMGVKSVLSGYFEEDLEYIAKVYPDEVKQFCPNLPYYGGYVGVAGEYAFWCPSEDLVESTHMVEIRDSEEYMERNKPFYAPIDNTVTEPVIILWTRRLSNRLGYIKKCPKSSCLITENRNWLNHSLTKAVYFYGTAFRLTDLPLPRPEGQLWVLQHEESPKNSPVFSYRALLELFNVTSTFRQQSHLPITTQYLRSVEDLESWQYVKSFSEKSRYQEKGLAPIIYVQSDCNTPSDRDRVVQWMMKYIKIDSYGKCLNNKQLPSHLQDPVTGLDHKDFIELVSKYKFAIAMENGICNDYITEKFWRPLIVGTVPITLGAPNIRDFAPDNKSHIDVRDFQSVKELVQVIQTLDGDEQAYEEYRKYKHTKVTNQRLRHILKERVWEPDFHALGNNKSGKKGNFMNHFDCYICDLVNDRIESTSRVRPIDFRVTKDHYGCPLPMEFVDENDLPKRRPFSDLWYSAWIVSFCEMQAMLELSKGGNKYYTEQALKSASRRCIQHGLWKWKKLE